jgi:carbon storage regulator
MLVLSRKRGQAIVLPELGVTFTILETQGRSVRIGISAPPGVTIHREEVWRRIAASRAEQPAENVRC